MGSGGGAALSPGAGGGGAYAVTMAAHKAGRWAASVRGSAWGARCARRSMRVGSGPYHGPRERLGCRRGKGAGGRMGVSPFDLGEVPSDEICRCGRSVPFSTRLGQTCQNRQLKKNRAGQLTIRDDTLRRFVCTLRTSPASSHKAREYSYGRPLKCGQNFEPFWSNSPRRNF